MSISSNIQPVSTNPILTSAPIETALVEKKPDETMALPSEGSKEKTNSVAKVVLWENGKKTTLEGKEAEEYIAKSINLLAAHIMMDHIMPSILFSVAMDQMLRDLEIRKFFEENKTPPESPKVQELPADTAIKV